MERIGQSEVLHLEPDLLWEGHFTVSHKSSINRRRHRCAEDPGYSYTACIMDHVAASAGCRLDWFRGAPAAAAEEEEEVATCSSRDEVLRFHDQLMWAYNSTFLQMATKSGCWPKCEVVLIN